MSFQPKSLWTPRDSSCLTDGEMGYDNSSRLDSKRGHQWFMDSNGPELFNNKKQTMEAVNGRPVSEMGYDNPSRLDSKQGHPWFVDSNGVELFNNKKHAMEAANGRPVSGVPHLAISPWENTSGFQSVPCPFSDRLFGSEPVRTINPGERNIQPVGNGHMNLGRNGFENQYRNDPSVGLSMSNSIEDQSSCLSFGGHRKVKVNEVRDSENVMSASMGHSYIRGDNNTISASTAYNKSNDNTISLGPTYNNGEENRISIGPAFNKADGNFISMGHTYSKGNGNFISMAQNYNKGNNSNLSMGPPFDKGDGSFISIGQSCEKGDSSFISLGSSYNKGDENFISMGATYGKANENFISMAPTYDKQTDNITSMGPTYDKADSNVVPIGPPYDKGATNSMSHNYNKNDSTSISFGSFHDEPETNPSGGIINSYDLLTNSQNTAPQSEELGLKDPVQSHTDPNVGEALQVDSKTDTVPKIKEPRTSRKAPTNNFPSNVKSLLSTGMFDGVPVNYVSWSREKNLKATIKGAGYLCSCDQCNHTKSLNAYEFERHAGAKTKHPNNHIYFENGKTIYAVVQELKNTPQDMLFEAIQTVTGSPINQKNFRIWKASYQAATRELQRIYGKDETTVPS